MGRSPSSALRLLGDWGMTQDQPRTVPLLPCCRLSIAAQVELAEDDEDQTLCEFSAPPDEHRLVKLNGEWRRLVAVLALVILAGCACPRPGHRGITPDNCALTSEAACRQQCSELTTSGNESLPGPANEPWQRFAGWERNQCCACYDYAFGTFSGSGVGRADCIEAAWRRVREGGQ